MCVICCLQTPYTQPRASGVSLGIPSSALGLDTLRACLEVKESRPTSRGEEERNQTIQLVWWKIVCRCPVYGHDMPKRTNLSISMTLAKKQMWDGLLEMISRSRYVMRHY